MTKTLIFSFPEYQELAKKISQQLDCELGDVTVRHFPDGESFVKLNSDVKNKKIILVCGLDNPDQKAMALMFFVDVVKESGAKEIGLVTPYLGYMRQDKRFNDGEAVTSNIFAKFLSKQFDWLITIDPHLHRHKSLSEIYSIPAKTLHASDAIANWIKDNIKNPLLIGPDEESQQWVSQVAKKAESPFIVLSKIRRGDKDVEVSIPDVEKYKNHTPILVDDIISTARTMIETVGHLHNARMQPPICIGIHAVFADNAYDQLKQSGTKDIITCNTINHHSNKIDISGILSESIRGF
ncbi:MAG: ribose-phosphate pyrophosphokinase [Rickettsiales bacterium]|jgi:ribose-phosphate pyrophosphokinase